MIFVQIMIWARVFECEDFQRESGSQILLTFATSLLSVATTMFDLSLQARALDESLLMYCLNCLQARQGWIPFLHQISEGELKRDAYDYGRIVCPYPIITGKALYFKFFKFQFTDVSLQNLISELATMSMKKERETAKKFQRRDKLVIYIGRSTQFVTLETVLHVYQLVAGRDDIEINLDGIMWDILIENSKKKQLIPTKNDQNQVFTERVVSTEIHNDQRQRTVHDTQNI